MMHRLCDLDARDARELHYHKIANSAREPARERGARTRCFLFQHEGQIFIRCNVDFKLK